MSSSTTLPVTHGTPKHKVIDAVTYPVKQVAPPPQRFVATMVTPVSADGVKQLMLAYRAAARRGKLAAVVPDFKMLPGMVYTKVRAISARINQNWDAWPSEELKRSYKTFLGKPIFVNHNNFDPERARGRVVASRYIEKGADKYIEVIQEADGQRYPKLGQELKTGGLDSVSMGVEAGFTVCSYCNNKATDVFDMCDHVKFHKGSYLPDPRTGEPKLVYENCYKLGFFELSYVFDPADETAVVSQVVTAGRRSSGVSDHFKQWHRSQGPDWARARPDELADAYLTQHPQPEENAEELFRHLGLDPEDADSIRAEHGYSQAPDGYDPRQGSRRRSINEIEAPEDIDTMSEDDQGDSDDDYEFVSPYHPTDEQDDIPFHGGVEPPEELLQPDMDKTKRLDRQQEDQGLDDDRAVEDVEEVGAPQDEGAPAARAATRRRSAMARSRTGSRRRYAEDAPPWADEDDSGQDGPPADDQDSGDADGSQDEDSLIDEAEADLEKARQDDDSGDDQSGDDEEGDEEDSDSDDGEGDDNLPPQFRDSRRQRPRQGRRRHAEDEDDKDSDDDSGDDSDDDDDDKDDDSDKPPWLKEKESRRRAPVRNGSPRKKGRKKGATVGAPALSTRGRVASQGRRQHFADDNGYTDGGPYGENDQGAQAEENINSVYGEGDGVPPEEPAALPTGDESKAPNSEAQLVARIQRQTNSLKGDIATWQRLQARKQKRGRRRHAEDVVDPTTVNPELSATDDQSLRGDDFQDPGLEDTTVHPTDGDSNNKIGRDQSRQWFAAFDNWLRSATGRSWNQHSSAQLTRLAARWSKNSGVPLGNLFPTLQTALREARKGEARRANVRRHAEDEALEVAAPDDRVDTEAPVSNDTDERAQSSQFDLGDYGHNAGDDLAKPENSSDSQIWAPDKGTTARVKMAEGVATVRCAEAYIKCGLAQPADKWKLATWLTTKRADIVDDRTKLLETVYAANRRAFTAAKMPTQRRAQTVPPGFSRGRVAATQRIADSDPINDAALWL